MFTILIIIIDIGNYIKIKCLSIVIEEKDERI